MKLVRYGPVGQEKPGLLDDAGVGRDLSPFMSLRPSDVITTRGRLGHDAPALCLKKAISWPWGSTVGVNSGKPW